MTDKRRSDIFQVNFIHHVKDSVEDELADTIIRIIDLMMFERYILMDCSDIITATTLELLLFDVAETIQKGYYSYAIYSTMAYCYAEKIDILTHIELKMKYNLTRPFKHGKLY